MLFRLDIAGVVITIDPWDGRAIFTCTLLPEVARLWMVIGLQAMP